MRSAHLEPWTRHPDADPADHGSGDVAKGPLTQEERDDTLRKTRLALNFCQRHSSSRKVGPPSEPVSAQGGVESAEVLARLRHTQAAKTSGARGDDDAQ